MATKQKATKQKATELKLSDVAVNLESARNAQKAYRALLHPLRSKLLTLLDNAKGKQLNVTTIYKKEKVEQSVASQHLAILRRVNLVKTERKGKEVLYSVNYKTLETLNKASALLV